VCVECYVRDVSMLNVCRANRPSVAAIATWTVEDVGFVAVDVAGRGDWTLDIGWSTLRRVVLTLWVGRSW